MEMNERQFQILFACFPEPNRTAPLDDGRYAARQLAILSGNMPRLRVRIVRFVDEYQPGIVECQFRDADGQTHSIFGKLPYFTSADLWSDSRYPQPGELECRLLGAPAHGAVKIELAEETTDGRSEVVVPASELIA